MDDPATRGGQGVASELLTDPHRMESDLKMLSRAVREDWHVPPEFRTEIIARLRNIVRKPTVQVLTKAGPFDSEGDADKHAIAATAVLERMVKTNQAERHQVWGLEQADRHHAEGSKAHTTQDIRIIVADATGATKPVGSLRELYANYPAALPAPDPAAPGPVQAESGDGGPSRG